jgi:hypothetical protein
MSQRQTLLEMTQEILESMQSDIVESIEDTGESRAVARIIRRVYWDIFGPNDLPEHYSLFTLDETSSATPTLMRVPDNVMGISWIKYNTATSDDPDDRFQEIPFQDLKQFLGRLDRLTGDPSEVGQFSFSFHPNETDNILVKYQKGGPPRYYTTPDEDFILFDQYDDGVDEFLRKSKTQCFGLIDSDFTLSDEFVPDLKPIQFAMLVNEAKALAFAELKQTQHGMALARARALRISAQKTRFQASKPNPLDIFPDFGRKVGRR